MPGECRGIGLEEDMSVAIAQRFETVSLNDQSRVRVDGQANHLRTGARAAHKFVELDLVAQEPGETLQAAVTAIEVRLDDGAVEKPQAVCWNSGNRAPAAVLVQSHDLRQRRHPGRGAADHS